MVPGQSGTILCMTRQNKGPQQDSQKEIYLEDRLRIGKRDKTETHTEVDQSTSLH